MGRDGRGLGCRAGYRPGPHIRWPGAPLTEREVREALGLSHRAASMALDESEPWGWSSASRYPRIGRRGPRGVPTRRSAALTTAAGSGVIDHRKVREGDPIVERPSEPAVARPPARPPSTPTTRSWSPPATAGLVQRPLLAVRPGDRDRARARAARARAGPADSSPETRDETILRLVRLLVTIPEEEVVPVLDRESPLTDRCPTGDQADGRCRPDGGPLTRSTGRDRRDPDSAHAIIRSARDDPARSNGGTPGLSPGRRGPREVTGDPAMTVETSTWATKKGLAQMLKGGVIMDVVTARPGQDRRGRWRSAVMALERVPSDIRAAGGVARMSDPR